MDVLTQPACHLPHITSVRVHDEDVGDIARRLAREARGETNYVPLPEVRRRLGLTDSTAD